MDEDDFDSRATRDGGGESFPGAELFRGKSPRAVLHLLLDHDPFELAARVTARLEQRALLLSHDRVWLRTLARVAHAAPGYRGRPPLDEWLRGRLDKSMDEILAEQVQQELEAAPLELPAEPHHAFVTERFGVEPGQARRACVRFNGLPDRVRHTFFALTVHGRSVHRHVAEGHGPPERVQADFETAVRALAAYPDAEDLDLWGTPW